MHIVKTTKLISRKYDQDCGKVNPNSEMFETPNKKLEYISGNSVILQIL